MKIENITDKHYTKSVEEIAYLRFKGFKFLEPPIGDGKYRWACFPKSERLQKTVQEFYNGSDEKKLFDELRNAKQYLMD